MPDDRRRLSWRIRVGEALLLALVAALVHPLAHSHDEAGSTAQHAGQTLCELCAALSSPAELAAPTQAPRAVGPNEALPPPSTAAPGDRTPHRVAFPRAPPAPDLLFHS
jgi:hypothetical protein